MDVSTGEIRDLDKISKQELQTGKWREIPEGFERAFEEHGHKLSTEADRIAALKAARRKVRRKAQRAARRRNRR